MSFDFSPATWKKVVRTFVGGFIAIYGIPAILGALSGSQPVDLTALRSAAVAGLAAVVALFWNSFLDPSPVPSLAVKPEDHLEV